MLYTYILKQKMHITYYNLFYFNKNDNIIFKTISFLENIKYNSQLFYHKFFTTICVLVVFTL